MSRPRVVLHIGLHKTATRFLQRAVFRQLDRERFLVNPEPLFHALRRAARFPHDPEIAEQARSAAANTMPTLGERTLVISDPSISGDMYSSHVDYKKNLELARELFPDATILYFVRRQSDWLQSAYRQALVKGRGMPIERFLNYYDGDFQPRIARRVNGVRNVEALTLRFLDIYRDYSAAFGPERVYLLRQEDLRQRPEAVYFRLAEALGVSELPQFPQKISGNRAFSALAIYLFFGGVRRRPQPPDPATAGQVLGILPARLDRVVRRLRTAFVKHAFDKIVYKDWDLLERHDLRERLDEYYEAEFETLTCIADEVVSRGPGTGAQRLAESPGPSRS